MSSLHFRGPDRLGDLRNGVSFAVILTLTVASAMTGAVVALVVQRYMQRNQMIEVLPAPTPIRHLQEQATATTEQPQPAVATPDLARHGMSMSRPTGDAEAASPLGAVGSNLSLARIAELERLLAEDDVIAGDGTDVCPAEFPIKANGRSGIYHWPSALAYPHTRATLCFKTTEAADRAGFRPAKR